MKLQDLHPFDSAIVGLNNVYFIDYQGKFHINSPFIIAPNETICTGSTFILIYSRNSKNCIAHTVRLQDAYYDDGIINLIVQDIVLQVTYTIDQQIECTGDHYRWILIDLNYFTDKMNDIAIQSYCGNCTDTKKKSVVDSYHIKLNNDLLQFDF